VLLQLSAATTAMHVHTQMQMHVQPPPRVAVLGATGRLGRETVAALLERNIPVKILVRPESRGDALDALLLEWNNSNNDSSDSSNSSNDNELVEVVTGQLLAATTNNKNNDDTNGCRYGYSDDAAQPSDELLECLEGCSVCVACYGATRTTKLRDLLGIFDSNANPEDTDPTHPKQINYRSVIALVRACRALPASNSNSNSSNNDNNNTRIRHIVRVTGKGEDPTGLPSVLLNGLGSFCKLWNYQGETVLRHMNDDIGDDNGNNDDHHHHHHIGYTIVRPGVMVETLRRPPDLQLADNGGNDLPVTPVTRAQIAELLAELAVGAARGGGGDDDDDDASIASNHNGNHGVTLAAMNAKNDGDGTTTSTTTTTLRERIRALTNDSRRFPDSLVREHKEAVAGFFQRVVAVVVATAIAVVVR